MSATAINYFIQNENVFLDILKDFVAIPSVSADSSKNEQIQRAADFLSGYLKQLGFLNIKLIETDKHPVVFAELKSQDPAALTLLVYGHYDVQPADPTDEWKTPAFSPTIIGDYLYGRGASDMKGQVMACLFAIESIIQTSHMPINIKVIFEGEEEIGSPSLDNVLKNNKDLLKADVILNPDAGMVSPDKPTIVYGLRGLAYFELMIRGPKADLHSGMFGGIIHNPAIVLSEVVSGMHDGNGQVTLPGFYDNVINLSSDEKARIASLDISEQHYIEMTGVKQLHGEKGYTLLERLGARPTLDVNGLYSGYIGEGAKTIIPSYASAKISCRLVPNQDPNAVYGQFIKYLELKVPPTVTWELKQLSGGPAYLTGDAPGLTQMKNAFEKVWNKPVVYKREGGSVPVATAFKEILGVDSILTGFGLPDDQIHSPNERLHLPTWNKGVQALINFLLEFAN